MRLSLNGKDEVFEQDALSVAEVLRIQDVPDPDMVSVQLNGDFLDRDVFSGTEVRDGDALEFLYFMGGGQAVFSNDQVERYSRHILLKDVGGKGQRALLESRVLVVGAGGLGSPVATYLAAAGVGTIGLVDADRVDLSNLQRQILHRTADVGELKVESGRETIEAINPDVSVELHPYRLDAGNVRDVIREYDFIVEGTDNFPTKFLVNDACVLEKKPFNQGGILRFKGQTMTYVPGSASYRCVYRQPPPPGAVPTCSEAGVLGAIPGILGSIQAAEVLKFITGAGDLLTNRVLSFDALAMGFRIIDVKPTGWAVPVSEGGLLSEDISEYENVVCSLEDSRKERKEAGLKQAGVLA